MSADIWPTIHAERQSLADDLAARSAGGTVSGTPFSAALPVTLSRC
jgi:hypothetical protein